MAVLIARSHAGGALFGRGAGLFELLPLGDLVADLLPGSRQLVEGIGVQSADLARRLGYGRRSVLANQRLCGRLDVIV